MLRKQILIVLIAVFVCSLSTFTLWEEVRYQSPANGLSVVVPDDTEIADDTEESLALEGSDFTLMFQALDTEGMEGDHFSAGLQEVCEGAEVKLSDMQRQDFSNDTFKGVIYSGTTEEGDAILIGGLDVTDADNISFLFSLTYGEGKKAWAEALIKGLEFHPEAIE